MNKEEIAKKAEEIIADSKITSYPVDIIKIAHDNDFKVFEQYLPKTVSGMIMINDEKEIDGFDCKRVIVVNKYDAPLRRRFTIAHELAHYFIHKSVSGTKLYAHRDEGNNDTNEIDANYFASSLLMPKGMLLRAVNNIKDKSAGMPDSFVENIISNQFQVSLSAARTRLQQLNLI